MSNILSIKNLAKSFGSRRVVKDVSLEINNREIVGLLGPNGAGKTTCFYMITGLINSQQGNISLNNKDITRLSMHKRSQLGLSYLPQEKSIFRKMSVSENILAVLELRKDLNKKQRQAHLNSLLDEFNISHLRDIAAPSLSGGECRRVELARALATEPKILLLDEPFAGIDPISINDIKKMIVQLKERNIGILITDHNVRETLNICDRAYVINSGTVLTHGTAKEIISHKTVKDIYLGHEFKI
jgi:lipopolysaccharide export system ATP-binding protein